MTACSASAELTFKTSQTFCTEASMEPLRSLGETCSLYCMKPIAWGFFNELWLMVLLNGGDRR